MKTNKNFSTKYIWWFNNDYWQPGVYTRAGEWYLLWDRIYAYPGSGPIATLPLWLSSKQLWLYDETLFKADYKSGLEPAIMKPLGRGETNTEVKSILYRRDRRRIISLDLYTVLSNYRPLWDYKTELNSKIGA